MNERRLKTLPQLLTPLLCALALGSCTSTAPTETSPATPPSNGAFGNIIPMPDSIQSSGGSFRLTNGAGIFVEPGTAENTSIGDYLAEKLRPATGFTLEVSPAAGPPPIGNIYLTTTGVDQTLGDEGYLLTVSNDRITLAASQPAGLFRGVQTIRQLMPPAIEYSSLQQGPWKMATGVIRDKPRFPWRGAMLDVARHFFSVHDVERFIDLAAYYKLNRVHLHLADDQGWRIVINAWPKLTSIGGSTQVGEGPGGFYTQADYGDIVDYAQRRHIIIIPEIDMPGHTTAALASYAELNCSGIAPPLYTGIGVGFSALCAGKDITYTFVDDVIRELAALTPGPYLHIGGDEANAMSAAEYATFIDRAQASVQSYGKKTLGWEEIAQGHLLPGSVVQHWNSALAQQGVQQGAHVIMSPAGKTYFDMKYTSSTALGQNWAGYIEVKDAYSWDPASQLGGVSESDILGVEAPLWTETIQTMADIEYMTFPRLACFAEIGWSRSTGRSWDEYRARLGSHGPRLRAMGVNFYQSPQVPWE